MVFLFKYTKINNNLNNIYPKKLKILFNNFDFFCNSPRIRFLFKH